MAKTLDYDAPFLLDIIYREPPQHPGHSGKVHKQELAGIWDNIISVQSYPFQESDWLDFKDEPKFLLTLQYQGSFVCLGDFKTMFQSWKTFLKKYYGKDSNL